MKTMYIECNMGASGDMLMSALYEICDSKTAFLQTMNEVFAEYGIRVVPEKVTTNGICGTHMHVKIYDTEEGDALYSQLRRSHGGTDISSNPHDHENADDDTHTHAHEHEHDHAADGTHSHEHEHVTYNSILERIGSFKLPAEVKEDAAAIYRIIGDAEAAVHGSTIDNIHFHEVGTLDALCDVTGCALLVHMIAPEQIFASPIHVGNGFVKCAHGVLPVPAPATAEILKGVPYYTGAIASELCTPTGAAILKYYVKRFSSMHELAPNAIGYGIGTKEFEIANCVRIFLGESTENEDNDADITVQKTPETASDDDYDSFPPDDYVYALSANIDDMTGEAIGLATEIFMAAGALDVYTIPIQMKKNRPGILLTCLCALEDKEKFTGLFFLHTSTRGVRYEKFARAKLNSTMETRSTSYGSIHFKKSTGYGVQKEKPEFEDLKSVVLKNECSVSLEDVARTIRR
jgi:hypothetical protein